MITACVYLASMPTGESGEPICAISSSNAVLGLASGSVMELLTTRFLSICFLSTRFLSICFLSTWFLGICFVDAGVPGSPGPSAGTESLGVIGESPFGCKLRI